MMQPNEFIQWIEQNSCIKIDLDVTDYVIEGLFDTANKEYRLHFLWQRGILGGLQPISFGVAYLNDDNWQNMILTTSFDTFIYYLKHEMAFKPFKKVKPC